MGYEWTLEADLDESFSLLLKRLSIYVLTRFDKFVFVAFLEGIIRCRRYDLLASEASWYGL